MGSLYEDVKGRWCDELHEPSYSACPEMIQWMGAQKANSFLDIGGGLSTLAALKLFPHVTVVEQCKDNAARILQKANPRSKLSLNVLPNEPDGWYGNFDQVEDEYDIIHLDGPRGAENRYGILRHNWVTGCGATIIVDDVHREDNRLLALAICNVIGKEECLRVVKSEAFECAKSFAIIEAK